MDALQGLVEKPATASRQNDGRRVRQLRSQATPGFQQAGDVLARLEGADEEQKSLG